MRGDTDPVCRVCQLLSILDENLLYASLNLVYFDLISGSLLIKH